MCVYVAATENFSSEEPFSVKENTVSTGWCIKHNVDAKSPIWIPINNISSLSLFLSSLNKGLGTESGKEGGRQRTQERLQFDTFEKRGSVSNISCLRRAHFIIVFRVVDVNVWVAHGVVGLHSSRGSCSG